MKNKKYLNRKKYILRDIVVKSKPVNFSKSMTRFFVPSFLIGSPNLRDNLKILRKHPWFKPFRMAFSAWLIFTLTMGSAGIYSLISAPRARAADSWYDASWQYRKKITFDNSAQAENLLNFPVLVTLDKDSDIDYSKTKSSGQVLRFTDSDGTTLLKYEIEKWDTTGSSYIWVKVPQIDGSSATDYVYMYYGNTGASDAQDVTNVWDSSFLGVWHANDNSLTTLKDSTSNQKDATKQSSGQPAYTSSGAIAGAQTYTQGNSRAGTTINSALTDFTVEVWFKDDAVATSYERLADKSYTGCFWFGRNSSTPNSWGGGVMETSDPYGVFVNLTDNQWHQVVSERSGTTHWVYGDGGSVSAHNTVSGSACATGNFGIGGYGDGATQGQWFGGIIDEVRLSSIARSDKWIAASYKSGKDTFNTFGTEEIADHSPTTPTNSSPANASTRQSITPTLTSSAFSDPDVGDTQTAAEWQITTTSGNYTSLIYDSGTDTINKTSITVPGSTLNYGTTYYWHVRYEDNKNAGNLSWSSYSTETSFTTVARPVTPVNSSPVNGSINQETFLTLSASAFSDTDLGSSHSASEWQVRNVSDATYSSPVYDSGVDASNLTTVDVPTGTLEKNTVYYWHVRYSDELGNWSAYSTETVFTTGVTPITVVSIGATEYQSGETAKLTVQLQGSDGTPINDANTTITIFGPSNTAVVNASTMTYLPSSGGLYYYNYTIPSSEGVYTYQVTAEYNGNTSYSSHAFHISPALNTIAVLNTNLNNVNSNLNTANTNLNTANSNLSTVSTNLNTANTNISNVNTNLTNSSLDLSNKIEVNKNKLNSLISNMDVLIGALIVTQSTINDSSATATSFITSLTNSVDDFYKNSVLTFTSGNLDGQVRRISVYNGSTKLVTLDPALTSIPASGDAFTITKQNARVEEQATNIKTKVDDTNTKVTDIQTKTTDIQSKVTDIQTKTNSIYSLLQTVDTNLSTTQAAVNTIRNSQQKMYALNLSDVSSMQAGSNYRATLSVRDYEGNPIDALTIPNIKIYSPTRVLVQDTTAMTKLSTGVYEYVYSIPSSATTGLWEAIVNVNTGGAENNILNDYWQVTGSPAQVVINSISDLSVPTITANASIQNEGGGAFEYQYEYCVVATQDNACGGGDDIAYASGAKLIQAGDMFTKDLTLNVPNPGTYWFKVVAYYGTQASGASQQFVATSGTVLPPPVSSLGGGGGGYQVTNVDTFSGEINTLRQEIQAQSKQLAKTLALLGHVDPNAPGFKSILDINLANTENIKEVQNKISDLKALSETTKVIVQKGSQEPIVKTWFTEGSIILNVLVTNPSSTSRTYQIKQYLPKEIKPDLVIDIDPNIKLEYDSTLDNYYISGEVLLKAHESKKFFVRAQDVFQISDEEISSLRKQAETLMEPLRNTNYFAQATISKSDIDPKLDFVTEAKKVVYPNIEDKISKFREQRATMDAVKSDVEVLKSLALQVSAAGGIVGKIGGIQASVSWGIIAVIIFGFLLLAGILFAMWRSQVHHAIQTSNRAATENSELIEALINRLNIPNPVSDETKNNT